MAVTDDDVCIILDQYVLVTGVALSRLLVTFMTVLWC